MQGEGLMGSKKTSSKPALEGGQNHSDVSSTGIKAISEISRAALTALGPAPPIFKVFIVAIVLAPLVAIVAGFVFLVRDYATYAFILFLAAIFLPGLEWFDFLRRIKPLADKTTNVAGEGTPLKAEANVLSEWRRTVPKYPIQPTALGEMGQLLERIRQSSFSCLHAVNTSLQDRQIRANVFLADYRKTGDGIACELFMPEELRKNMKYSAEWNLRFKPGQGATGCVFIEGVQRVTRRRSSAEGDWESVLEMSDELKAKVHKDLKWIVSLPLKDPASQSALAVLNIDGLDHDFTDEALTDMLASVSKESLALADLMVRQPRVNLSIRMEEN